MDSLYSTNSNTQISLLVLCKGKKIEKKERYQKGEYIKKREGERERERSKIQTKLALFSCTKACPFSFH